MSRITEDTRKRIAVAAINHKYAPINEAVKAEEAALALECHRAVYPAAELAIIATLPKDWIRSCKCLRFNAGGWTVELCASEEQPTHASSYCTTLGTITGELADRVQAFAQRKKTMKQEHDEALRQMLGFLESFKSFKQLRDAWPEGVEFYKQYDVTRPAAGVPAVRVAAINEMLGIKGEAA